MKASIGYRLLALLLIWQLAVTPLAGAGRTVLAEEGEAGGPFQLFLPWVVKGAADITSVLLTAADYQSVADHLRPQRVLDYGAFVWLEVNAADLAQLNTLGVAYAPQPADAHDLLLNQAQFDPLRGQAALAPEQTAVYAPGQKGFHLVQFFGPTKDEWLEALRALDAVPVQYQPQHAYIVWMTPEAAQKAARLAEARWVGVYQPAYRVLPGLWGRAAAAPPQTVLEHVIATVYDGDDMATLTLQAIEKLGGRLVSEEKPRADEPLRTWRLALPAAALPALAQLPAVLWLSDRPAQDALEDEMSGQIIAGNFNPLNTGYQAWLTGRGVNGAGVTVALVDTGYDTGADATSHQDLRGRLVMVGTPTDTDGHGTHVGGIIAGNGALGTNDASGYRLGLGVAPNATLVVRAFTGNDADRTRDSVANGAVASNNSYALHNAGDGYTNVDRTYDQLVRDADTTSATTAQPLVIVFSAGNSGTAGPTKEAKNIIAVGNSFNQRNGPGAPLAGNGQIDTLAGTSSRGPARDGRMYPHLSAPGSNIISTRSTQVNIPPAPGTNPSCEVVATGAPAANPTYAMCSGTSMAAPHVTGAVALITQWWRGFNGGANPSPAMAKALLTNGTVDMGTADRPNSNEGWGRINLSNVINPPAPAMYWDQATVFGATGASWTASVRVVNPALPMRITLVWSDAAGPGSGGTTAAWVNDLNLTVTQGGATWRGNNFAGGWSTPGGAADGRNNAENVFLQSPTGAYTLRVDAANIAGDGVPFNGDGTDQDFAVVCFNCALPPDLRLTKTDAADPVTAGTAVDYTLQVANLGPAAASNVIITDPVPAGLTPAVLGPGCSQAGGVITCAAGNLAPGASRAFNLRLAVPASLADGTVLVNTAQASAAEFDLNPADNTASQSTTVVRRADLALTKTAEPGATLAGQPITYTLTALNLGPSEASRVVVVDTLPAGTALMAGSGLPACTEAGGVVTCAIGALLPGASATVSFTVTSEASCAPVVNQARVGGAEVDPAPANNLASASSAVWLDDFARPDGPLGGVWGGVLTRYQVAGAAGVGRFGDPIYWPEAYGPEQTACVTLVHIDPLSTHHSLMLKVRGHNDYGPGAILVSYNGLSQTVDVESRLPTGGWTLNAAFPVVMADGDRLGARALADGRVEVYVNGVLIGLADAGPFYAGQGGQIGLWMHKANPALFDDFSGGHR